MKYVRPMHPILSNVQATNRTSNDGNAGRPVKTVFIEFKILAVAAAEAGPYTEYIRYDEK